MLPPFDADLQVERRSAGGTVPGVARDAGNVYHPELQRAAEAVFAALVRGLHGTAGRRGARGLGAGPGAAWSLVHGLTMLLIDHRLSVLGMAGGATDRYARAAATALVDGLRA